eukprot:FR735708.1.p4 GENE.FR735708.1~~FR735708.1.p4  ORF type:complete len:110 (-),score=22.98 FR735708.1:547-876(-)
MPMDYAKRGNLPSIKGTKSWSSPAGAAALELVDPLGCHSLRPLFFFFFFFYRMCLYPMPMYSNNKHRRPKSSPMAMPYLSYLPARSAEARPETKHHTMGQHQARHTYDA